ncbi:MAG TPA: tetratricopeptide repeat protein [Candidatus Polarisedimenticolaceae bacterium]|nr:tetratricopeptide repeat protein [Candidatus Polarisedimenticolaceae bacterium]
MATAKKKTAGPETPGETPARPARSIPRNIAQYEAALAAFSAGAEAFGKGQFAQARTQFAAVIDAAKGDEPILADRARTYASICDRKLAGPESGPDDAESLYHRGVVLANAGRLDEAWSTLERALTARPGDASILYARASVRGLQGNVEGAASELKKALTIDPTFRFHAASDSDFDSVRDEAAFIDVIEPSHAGA